MASVATSGAGPKVSYGMELRSKDGLLVYAEKTRKSGLLRRYDKWRSHYCHTHRHDTQLPWLRFREGKTDPLTMAYALSLRVFG